MPHRTRPSLWAALLALAAAQLPASAWALSFTIQDRNATAFPTLVGALADQLERIVNQSLFPTGIEDSLLGAMGSASASATRGFGTDPVSEWNTFSATAQAAAALRLPQRGGGRAGARTNQLPAFGLGGQTGVSVGLPAETLGIRGPILGLTPNRLRLYANFMTLNLNQVIDDVGLGFTTFGLHGHYLAIPGEAPRSWMRWTGLAVSSGLQYSRLQARYATPLDFSATSGVVTMSYLSRVDIGVLTSILTLPIEATTGVTLLDFLTLYGGGGIDLNAGTSRLEGRTTGPVTAKDNSSTLVFTGTGVLDANSPSGVAPPPADMRLFAGIQLNLWAARLFAQGTVSSPRTLGVLAGLRASW